MASEADSPLAQARKVVENLIHFRDHYFEHHSLDNAGNKDNDIQKEIVKTLSRLAELEGGVENKAEFFLLKGKAYNVVSDFSPEAQEHLSKAVKLDPKLVDAWNQLGESFWKKSDVDAAKNCFQGALQHSRNKVSLRNLSMILRHIGSTKKEKVDNVEESVKIAKEALQMDVKDGVSWYVLGNSLLSSFFGVSQNPQHLKQCMCAYANAEKDPVAACLPDLFYNRGMAHKFEEEYLLALESFEKAHRLDPSWQQPVEASDELLRYLDQVSTLVNNKGKLKAKRLQNMMESIEPSLLGPYAGGTFQNSTNECVTLQPVTFDELQQGVNPNKVTLGKVVCSVNCDVPFTFCMVDSKGDCLAATVYNIALGQGCIISDSVAIPDPFVQNTDITWKGQRFAFRNVRVSRPTVLVVNGKKWNAAKEAPTELKISAFSE